MRGRSWSVVALVLGAKRIRYRLCQRPVLHAGQLATPVCRSYLVEGTWHVRFRVFLGSCGHLNVISGWRRLGMWPGAFAKPQRDFIEAHRALPKRGDQVGDLAGAGHEIISSRWLASTSTGSPPSTELSYSDHPSSLDLTAWNVFLFWLPHSG